MISTLGCEGCTFVTTLTYPGHRNQVRPSLWLHNCASFTRHSSRGENWILSLWYVFQALPLFYCELWQGAWPLLEACDNCHASVSRTGGVTLFDVFTISRNTHSFLHGIASNFIHGIFIKYRMYLYTCIFNRVVVASTNWVGRSGVSRSRDWW